MNLKLYQQESKRLLYTKKYITNIIYTCAQHLTEYQICQIYYLLCVDRRLAYNFEVVPNDQIVHQF